MIALSLSTSRMSILPVAAIIIFAEIVTMANSENSESDNALLDSNSTRSKFKLDFKGEPLAILHRVTRGSSATRQYIPPIIAQQKQQPQVPQSQMQVAQTQPPQPQRTNNLIANPPRRQCYGIWRRVCDYRTRRAHHYHNEAHHGYAAILG